MKKLNKGQKVKVAYHMWLDSLNEITFAEVEVYSSGKLQTKFNGAKDIWKDAYKNSSIFNKEDISCYNFLYILDDNDTEEEIIQIFKDKMKEAIRYINNQPSNRRGKYDDEKLIELRKEVQVVYK